MNKSPYSYNRRYAMRYTFVSKGPRGAIVKVVEFTPLSEKNILNLGFGDMLENGTIDDTVATNNNDIIKVLATIVQIVKEFTAEHPDFKIAFKGNTLAKNSLYGRILKMYYQEFSKSFTIAVVVKDGEGFIEKPLEPTEDQKCLLFLVKRKL